MTKTNTPPPPGYHQTKIGVLPVDWEVVRAKNVCDKISVGIVIKPADLYVKNGIRAFRSANVREGFIEDHKWVEISLDGHLANQKSTTELGDVLVVRTGYPGTAATVTSEYVGLNVIDLVIGKPNKEKLLPKYLESIINSSIGKAQVFAKQGGLAQKHFNVGDFKELQIPLPPLPEQKKIATLLATWDAGIRTLTQLIAAKRERKRGLMQKLLTGEVRLPGFEGEWKYYKMDDALEYKQPTKFLVSSKLYSDEYNIPVLTAGKTFLLGFTNDKEGIYSENLPVIIFDDFTTTSKWVDFPFKVKSSAMKFLSLKSNKHNLRFVFEKMQILQFKPDTHKRHWISEYSEIDFRAPELEEQTAIATILTTADQEITLLEDQLAALGEQKRGLMQRLLTGAVRVQLATA